LLILKDLAGWNPIARHGRCRTTLSVADRHRFIRFE
jgi:hypothetical protein